MKSFLARLRAFFRKEKLDRDMSEELSEHLQLRIERNLEAGMSPEDARYAAMRAFGGVEQIKERCREERSFVWGEQLWQDMRYGLRSLRKAPGFTTVAVVTLGIKLRGTEHEPLTTADRVSPITAIFEILRVSSANQLGVRLRISGCDDCGRRRWTNGRYFFAHTLPSGPAAEQLATLPDSSPPNKRQAS